ncbi:hypothetical protein EJ06DRAFT_555462 [Trichodelitschia bisporula]|uniref:Uncharacterized protein n=1 Tax=Trichodelitschia bisporula TaxID=703511 RepID=A0A6G1I129_9PEZI|nr:hypothetical protein EJ06DRAFT_555462 [Trichodelitschia bisporula]
MDSSSPPQVFAPNPSVLSPPLSEASLSGAPPQLPAHPRQHPLKPGSTKESTFIRFLDQDLLKIQRRYALRDEAELRARQGSHQVQGFKNFPEAAKEIEKAVDLLWLSGTPSLQVPYLLTIASLVVQFLPGFTPAPKTTLKLLDKLDLVFASLLRGRHAETDEELPSCQDGRAVSGTEKVRIKSLVEQTRRCIMETLSKADEVEDEEEEEVWNETVDEMDTNEPEISEEDMERELRIGQVYERTLSELGDVLGGIPIGIITDP